MTLFTEMTHIYDKKKKYKLNFWLSRRNFKILESRYRSRFSNFFRDKSCGLGQVWFSVIILSCIFGPEFPNPGSLGSLIHTVLYIFDGSEFVNFVVIEH